MSHKDQQLKEGFEAWLSEQSEEDQQEILAVVYAEAPYATHTKLNRAVHPFEPGEPEAQGESE